MKSKLRVAIVGKSGGLLSWAEDLAEGFRACATDVRLILLRTETWPEWRRKFQHGETAIHNERVQERIGTELRRFHPDLLVVLNRPSLPYKAAEIWREALPRHAKSVAWLCDGRDHLPANETCTFDIVYSFETASIAALSQNGALPLSRFKLLPLAVNPNRFTHAYVPAASRAPYLVFAGNCTPDRHREILRIRAAGERVEMFGPHSADWRRWWRNRAYSANALARLYAGHLASLNLLQTANTRTGLNLRAFEIACVGGIGTYPDVADVRSCFTPESEILTHRNPAELHEQMGWLRADHERADRLARAGQDRCLHEHTYRHRAARMLKDLEL